MEKSIVQEDENTQVECKTLIKKAGGSGRMKASRADGCVKIKVVGVSGRTCQKRHQLMKKRSLWKEKTGNLLV